MQETRSRRSRLAAVPSSRPAGRRAASRAGPSRLAVAMALLKLMPCSPLVVMAREPSESGALYGQFCGEGPRLKLMYCLGQLGILVDLFPDLPARPRITRCRAQWPTQ